MSKTFSEKVVELALSVPPGRVTTYGRIAIAAGGGSMASQSISNILWRAQQERGIKNIPWHRIVYADGKVWLDEEHKKKRLALYKKEKIVLDKNNRIENFVDKLWEFK